MDIAQTNTAESKWARWGIPLLVAAVTFAAFLPALQNGFVNWDDERNFLNNYMYRGLGWEQLKWMFANTKMGPYAPLPTVTFGFDYLVWGMNPSGYHFTSVALHSACAAVFYTLCLKLLAPLAADDVRKNRINLRLAAAFAALFFSVHPLRVESAVWLSARHDILACLFYLLALLWYISPRSASDGETTLWHGHLLPLAAFLLALISKGMAISLPVVLVIIDIYPLKRLSMTPKQWFSHESRHVWIEKIPYFLMSLVFGLIGYAAQGKAGALVSVQAFGFGSRIATALYATGFYVWKTVIPVNLVPFYKLPAGFGLTSGPALLGGTFVLAATIAVLVLRRRWPAWLAIWAYYLVALSPVVGFVKINTQAAADRYAYLSCLGFALLAGAGLFFCRKIEKKFIVNTCSIFACLIIIGLSYLTWRQTGVWRNSETLWTHALSVNPELDLAYNNLGTILAEQGKNAEAEAHYREALRINPGSAEAYNNIGLLVAAQGKPDGAARHYQEALRINPDFAFAHVNLAIVLTAQEKHDEAVRHYREALRINPDIALAHSSLGVILAAQGKLDEAVVHYREALRANPDFALAHNNLGVILAAQGKSDEAAVHYREALRLGLNSGEAYNNLGLIAAAQGKLDEAAAHYRGALRINPNFAFAHNNLGIVFAAQGKPDEAAVHYLEALRLKPDYADAHFNLGFLFAAQGKIDKAIFHCREAVRLDPAANKHSYLGELLVAQGKFEEAAGHYREALRINPDYAEGHNNFGVLLAKQGKLAEAIKHFREALRVNPNYTGARNNLAVMLRNSR